MGKKTSRAIGIALATLIGAGAITVGASPALAASSCYLSSNQFCNTGIVAAGSDNQVTIRARPGTGKVTCRVHDAGNGNDVGSITVNAFPDGPEGRAKDIWGLNRTYFAVCTAEWGVQGSGTLT